MQKEAQQIKERDLNNLNKSCQDLRDQCMRLELAYSQATENFTRVTSQADRLHGENANLQAEKTLWKVWYYNFTPPTVFSYFAFFRKSRLALRTRIKILCESATSWLIYLGTFKECMMTWIKPMNGIANGKRRTCELWNYRSNLLVSDQIFSGI